MLTEIRSDLGRFDTHVATGPGRRGSGKTVVAALSALTAMASGCQCALMAPTEILAEQHFQRRTTLVLSPGLLCRLAQRQTEGS